MRQSDKERRGSERDAVSQREKAGESYCQINKGGGEIFVELKGCWEKEARSLYPA